MACVVYLLPPSCPLSLLPSLPPSITDEEAVGDITANRLSADDFDVVKVIGRGAFGEVQLVRECLQQSRVLNDIIMM